MTTSLSASAASTSKGLAYPQPARPRKGPVSFGGNLNPLVTILLPAKDAAPWLGVALESLCAQTFKDWRCLCLDDGSIDDTRALLAAAAAVDSRFTLLANDTPQGLPKALNQLLQKVETPFFARMDADDLCAPDRLERQFAASEEVPGIELWGSLVSPLGDPSEGWLQYLDWLNSVVSEAEITANAFTDHVLPHPTWFGLTDALLSAGGYHEGPFPEDYELFLRLKAAGCRFGKVNAPLLFWRDHPGRLTRTHPAYEADATLVMKTRYLAEKLRQNGPLCGKPVWVRGAGRTGRLLAETLLKGGVEVAGFSDPIKAGAAIMKLTVKKPEEVETVGNLVIAAVRPRHLKRAVEAELSGRNLTLGRDYLIIT